MSPSSYVPLVLYSPLGAAFPPERSGGGNVTRDRRRRRKAKRRALPAYVSTRWLGVLTLFFGTLRPTDYALPDCATLVKDDLRGSGLR